MRRIKKAYVRHISLVPRGANRLPVIYKSDDSIEFDPIVKADMEKGLLTAVVYAPESRDSQGDIASAEVIEEMSHDFAKNGEGVDFRHDGKVIDSVFVAESFIVQKGDARFEDLKDYAGNPVDATGGWAVVIKIEDEELRRAYRDGEWNGVSMGGTAIMEAEKEDASLGRQIIDTLKGLMPGREGDIDMKEADFQKALDDQANAIVKGVAEAFAKHATPEKADDTPKDTKTDDDAPIFKGDWSNPTELRKHDRLMKIYAAKLEHANDFAALAEAVEKINKDFEDEDDADGSDHGEIDHSDEKSVKKTAKSNQSASDSRIEKSDLDLMAAGRKAARIHNGVEA